MVRPINRIALEHRRRRCPRAQCRHPGRHTRRTQPRSGTSSAFVTGSTGSCSPTTIPTAAVSSSSTRDAVRGIVHMGGTIIGTTNRGNPTAFPVQQDDGTFIEVDRSEELIARFAEHGIDALITIGGDGSLTIGHHLYEQGLRVIGVPENDRQRPREDVLDIRFPHRGRLRHAVHRPAVLHGHIARPGDRRRGDGPLRRLDRTPFRRRGRRTRHAHPRDPVRSRTRGGHHPPA